MQSTLTKKQVKTFGPKPIAGWGAGRFIRATVRYDDECGNGHNTFAITGDIYKPGASDIDAGGCLHKQIAEAFPELAPLIKWHLCSSDGPMHYPGNVLYLAGDRDCWGLLKGETRQIKNGRTGVPAWHLVAVDASGVEVEVYELQKNLDAEMQPPCPYRLEYRPWNHIGEGKARELDLARSSAIWPEATDEDLTAPGLRERLEDRLPALMAEFRAAVESLGFTF